MKKMSREKVIELLENKNYTYRELSNMTGYHEKSLIRLNSQIKSEKFKAGRKLTDDYNNIIDDYLTGDFKNYRDFYNERKSMYGYKYSTICKILGTAPIDSKITFIRKVKTRSDCHFIVYDGMSGRAIMKMRSLKNDRKSIKRMIFKVLSDFGAPSKLCFINFFKVVPLEISEILEKYDIEIIPFKSIYRNILDVNSKVSCVKYRNVSIMREDFYDYTIRKCIAVNSIQFKNVRYKIESKELIPKNTKVVLYYDEETKDIFISYSGKRFDVKPYKIITPKLGNTKY